MEYLHWDEITITDFSDQAVADMYARGYVFTRIGKRYDRVYCPTYSSSMFLRNQVVTIHDLISMHYPLQHPLQYRFCKRALPILLRRAHKVIAISKATASEVQARFHLPSSKSRAEMRLTPSSAPSETRPSASDMSVI